MTQFYTPLKSTDTVNHTALNSRLTELSDAIDGVLDGTEAQPSPDILDFTNAQHDHEDAAGGGQLTVASFNSGDADVSYAVTADGGGGAELRQIITAFKNLTDTPNSFAGLAGQILGINSAEDAVVARNQHGVIDIERDTNYTSSSTTFVDIDSSELVKQINTVGGDVLVLFTGLITASPTTTASGYVDLDVDGSRIGGDDGLIVLKRTSAQVTIIRRITGLSAGPHTFKPQWKASSGGTCILLTGKPDDFASPYGQFVVMEVA